MHTPSQPQHTTGVGSVVAPSKRARKVVTSYGLICHRLRINFDAREVYPEFLVIQRKDTISFVEFIRGKYNPCNLEYVRKLISTMTKDEQNWLASQPFPRIWSEFWGSWKRDPQCGCESSYQGAHSAFTRLVSVCGASGLRGLVASVDNAAPEQEWSFPKGRKMPSETDVACAMREFEEETGYIPAHVHVFDVPPYEEVFEGSNGILYRHVYFLSRLVDMRDCPSLVPPPGSIRARETRCMQWSNYETIRAKFLKAPTRVTVISKANDDVISILAPGVCAP
jgi:8-oxo-dGTP pyrophosphatase MutT (NUDIX family)